MAPQAFLRSHLPPVLPLSAAVFSLVSFCARTPFSASKAIAFWSSFDDGADLAQLVLYTSEKYPLYSQPLNLKSKNGSRFCAMDHVSGRICCILYMSAF